MTKEEMVAQVKAAVALAKDGKLDEMYAAYATIFKGPGFGALRAEDQRQALKLMVHFKGAPKKATDPMTKAHDAAVASLTELVSTHNEPADFEMLGMCHLLLGREEAASNMFREGLKIERERSPGSDLCGTLMRRVSEL
jgi:hypothetical protein